MRLLRAVDVNDHVCKTVASKSKLFVHDGLSLLDVVVGWNGVVLELIHEISCDGVVDGGPVNFGNFHVFLEGVVGVLVSQRL